MFLEIVIGLVIGLAFIAGAVVFAIWTPRLKGPSRHDIRGNGDYSDSHVRGHRGFDSGGDGGGDGAD